MGSTPASRGAQPHLIDPVLAKARADAELRLSCQGRSAALRACFSIADLRRLAMRRLPRAIFDYLEGGAEDEVTARRNVEAFDAVTILPRCLNDVSQVETATTLFDAPSAWPLICSPTGGSRMYDMRGELAVARACADAGLIYGLSTMSNASLEEVGRETSAPKLFQLYVFRDRGVTRDLVARAKAAGFHALCITVDCAVRGKREREMRTGLGIPLRWSAAGALSIASNPLWFAERLGRGALGMGSLQAVIGSADLVRQAQYVDQQMDPTLSWADIEAIAGQWSGPLAIKGVMTGQDAARAAQAGATAVMVSNHGGRQLDGAASAFEALDEVVQAAGDRVEIILDGGVRRGRDIFKALAIGASACSIGRPYLYGLAAAGEAGVSHALAILQTEFIRTMQLSGCSRVDQIDAAVVRGVRSWKEPN